MQKSISLPLLPYAYDALEPVISRDTLKVHYEGHHGGYVRNFNAGKGDKRFNLNGHILHSYFWHSLKPFDGFVEPVGSLGKAVRSRFKSNDNFYDKLFSAFSSIQGSGWVVLGSKRGKLDIKTIPNHELQKLKQLGPIIVIDAWEHAYYLDYTNNRTKFFENLLSIINWEKADAIYSSFV